MKTYKSVNVLAEAAGLSPITTGGDIDIVYHLAKKVTFQYLTQNPPSSDELFMFAPYVRLYDENE